jgi:tRNA1(Val) A37 N6-methylase TrmN6
MEQLHNGYTLELCEGAFPLSTDSVALAHFARLPKNATVLDLGSGCGTLGMLLCAEDASCRVTGIELDEKAHLTALENASRNQLEGRLQSICADLITLSEFTTPGSFSCCVSNPPYFTAGPESQSVPLARREDRCTMAQLFEAAAWAVKYGGDFYLVHRPERLGEIFACAANVRMEPKRLCLLRHRPDSPVSLVLVQCRKGAKPGLLWEELCLHQADGSISQDYRKLYHL